MEFESLDKKKFESVTKAVLGECRRLERNKKVNRDVTEAFESAPEFDEIPIKLQRRIDEKLFYQDGPEVTVPADRFVFDY